MAKSELNWTSIDPAALPVDCQKAYGEYKAAYRAAKSAKDAFEAMARKGLPQPGAGQELKFAYNFGKLSIAVGPASAPKAEAAPKLNLAEWIKQQATL